MKLSAKERAILQVGLSEVAWPPGEMLKLSDLEIAVDLGSLPPGAAPESLSLEEKDYAVAPDLAAAALAVLTQPFKGMFARHLAPVVRKLKEASTS